MLPLPGLHVIDAVKVCLACGANVHRLVPVSESCCPLHMSARFLCLHYVNVQTSSHTMTTICQYAHQHACTLEKLGAPPHNNIPSCLQNQEKNQWSSDRDKGAWEEEQLKLFFFSFLFVSTLSSSGRCHSKSWWASRPARLSAARLLRLKRCEATPETWGLHCRFHSATSPRRCAVRD